MSSKAKLALGIGLFLCLVFAIAFGKTYYERQGMTTTGSSSYSLVESDEGGAYGGFGMGKVAQAPSYAADQVAPSASPSPAREERMVVRSSELSLVVKDLNWSLQQITDLALKKGGFVVESTVYKNGLVPVGRITVRIPAKEFSAGIAEVKNFGELESENIRGTDVTEEYVDLEARLKNYRASEAQLLEIMKRSGSIADVLSVQRELTQIRSEIESYEARRKYLQESVDLSVLTVNLSTDPSVLPVVEQDGSVWRPVAVVKEAIRTLIEVGQELAELGIWVLIFSPVWGIALLSIWLVRRKLRNKPTV